MAVATFTPVEILQKIRYDQLTKKGSVYDVICLVTGCEAKHAVTTFQRLQAQFPEVTTRCGNFAKFPGRGQRPTPVAFLKDLIEIAWLCPGKHAKEFRRTGAVTLCRALGGDLSLVEEIRARHGEVTETEQEALLAGTGVTVAEANGQALVVPTEEQLRRYKAETLAMEADARRELADAEAKTMETYKCMVWHSEHEGDERDKLFFKDAARNFIRSHFGSGAPQLESSVENEQVTISGVAADMGVRLRRGDDARIGKVAAELYKEKHGCGPPKHARFVDGAVRNVNLYFKKDRDVLEQAVSLVMDCV